MKILRVPVIYLLLLSFSAKRKVCIQSKALELKQWQAAWGKTRIEQKTASKICPLRLAMETPGFDDLAVTFLHIVMTETRKGGKKFRNDYPSLNTLSFHISMKRSGRSILSGVAAVPPMRIQVEYFSSFSFSSPLFANFFLSRRSFYDKIKVSQLSRKYTPEQWTYYHSSQSWHWPGLFDSPAARWSAPRASRENCPCHNGPNEWPNKRNAWRRWGRPRRKRASRDRKNFRRSRPRCIRLRCTWLTERSVGIICEKISPRNRAFVILFWLQIYV